jgi:predicted phage-related endonuclease
MKLPRIQADVIHCRCREPWLLARSERLHSTDAAHGLSTGEWLDVYASKAAPLDYDDSTETQRIKLASEATVRTIWEWKFGGKVHAWPQYTIAVSREYPWLACTPDSLLTDADHDTPGLQQIKCWSERDRDTWGDGPPLYVQVQTQIELLCTGLTWGYVATMFGTQVVERYPIAPDPEFLAAALPVLKAFWDRVLLREPPEPTGSQASAEALRRLHPCDNGLTVQLPELADDKLERLEIKKQLVTDAQKQVDLIENELRAALGDNTWGVTPAGKWVSWKTTAAGHRTFRSNASRPPGQIEYAAGSVANAADYANAPPEFDVQPPAVTGCVMCGGKIKAGSIVYHNGSGYVCRKCNEESESDAAVSFTTQR